MGIDVRLGDGDSHTKDGSSIDSTPLEKRTDMQRPRTLESPTECQIVFPFTRLWQFSDWPLFSEKHPTQRIE